MVFQVVLVTWCCWLFFIVSWLFRVVLRLFLFFFDVAFGFSALFGGLGMFIVYCCFKVVLSSARFCSARAL